MLHLAEATLHSPDPVNASSITPDDDGSTWRDHDPTGPGKFEGEPQYVVYYWDVMMNGGEEWADEDGSFGFNIDNDERATFPELDGYSRITLSVDDHGFVYHSLIK